MLSRKVPDRNTGTSLTTRTSWPVAFVRLNILGAMPVLICPALNRMTDLLVVACRSVVAVLIAPLPYGLGMGGRNTRHGGSVPHGIHHLAFLLQQGTIRDNADLLKPQALAAPDLHDRVGGDKDLSVNAGLLEHLHV